MKESRRHGYGSIAVLFVLMTLLLSCQSKGRYVGVYKAELQHREIVLELKENGEGFWRVSAAEPGGSAAEVRFVWYIKRGHLRIDTTAGGVIVGKPHRDTIRIALPGMKTLVFKKSG
jgi:hypothetical protein